MQLKQNHEDMIRRNVKDWGILYNEAQNVKTDLFFLLFTITYNEERKKTVNYNKNKLNKKYKITFHDIFNCNV